MLQMRVTLCTSHNLARTKAQFPAAAARFLTGHTRVVASTCWGLQHTEQAPIPTVAWHGMALLYAKACTGTPRELAQ